MERLVNHKDRNVYWGNKSNKKLASFFHWLTWNWTYFCGPIEKNAGLKFHICLTFQTQKLCSVLDHCYANNADGVTAARSLWLARCFRLVTNQEFKWEEIVHTEVTQWSVFPVTLQKSWCCNLCVVVNLHFLTPDMRLSHLIQRNLKWIRLFTPQSDDEARHISSVEQFIICQRHLRHLKVWHGWYDGIILGSSCILYLVIGQGQRMSKFTKVKHHVKAQSKCVQPLLIAMISL